MKSNVYVRSFECENKYNYQIIKNSGSTTYINSISTVENVLKALDDVIRTKNSIKRDNFSIEKFTSSLEDGEFYRLIFKEKVNDKYTTYSVSSFSIENLIKLREDFQSVNNVESEYDIP